MEEEQAKGLLCRGAGNCRALQAGHLVDLEALPGPSAEPLDRDLAGAYLLLRVHHSASGGSFPGRKGFAYSNTFTALPHDVRYFRDRLGVPQPLPYRPARQTPRPVMRGPQTAVVVGTPGEEITVDKYGRVKVQFHWDRLGQLNANSSCWVRVAQLWAGKRWGASFWPRVGQEVIVDFLEGDPDQPLIIGSVYNAEQMPPYLGDGLDCEHPHNPNLSGFKTNSTPGGDGYNELRFDDTKCKEQVYVHAERNLEIRVKNDFLTVVGNDCHTVVGGVDAGGNPYGDWKVEVGKDEHRQVKGNSTTATGGNQSRTVQGDAADEFKGCHSTTTAGEECLKASKVIVEAEAISLKGAGGFIVIDGSGVTIVGHKVKINSGGAPLSCACAAKAELPTAPKPAGKSRPGYPSKPTCKR